MATQTKVLSNALSQFGGKAITTIASLVIVKILTGFGKEFYGNYLTAYEFLAFFGILADAGLFAIAVREISKSTQEKAQKIFGNIFSMRLILIVFVTLLAGIVAQYVGQYDPEVKMGIWITGLSMALTILAGTMSSVLQARMKIHWFTLGLVAGKVFLAIAIWYLTQLSSEGSIENFYRFLWLGVASNIIFVSIVWWFARKEIKLQLRFEWETWKKILKESLPFGLALILQTLYLRLDVLLISILLGKASVGTYGVATRLLEGFFILSVFFGHAILPKISSEESDNKKSNQTFTWGAAMLLIVAGPILIAIPHFAQEIILLLSSPEFLSTTTSIGSDTILNALIITIFFGFFNQFFIFSLVAKGRQNYLLKVNAFALILNAILNLIFLPLYGMIAAAISTIICAVLVFVLLAKEIRRFFTFSWDQSLFVPIVIANGLLAAEIYLTPLGQNFPAAFIVGGLTYGGVLFWFRKRYV